MAAACLDAGATFVTPIALHLRRGVKEHFLAFVKSNAGPTSIPARRAGTRALPTCPRGSSVPSPSGSVLMRPHHDGEALRSRTSGIPMRRPQPRRPLHRNRRRFPPHRSNSCRYSPRRNPMGDRVEPRRRIRGDELFRRVLHPSRAATGRDGDLATGLAGICQHDPMDADRPDAGTWIIDLDGVIWLAQEAITGSADAVARLRQAGHTVVFATNNASPTIAEFQERLAHVGITTQPDDMVTSAQAAASMLEPGSTAVVCGDEGVLEALAARDVTVLDEGPADAVVVGWTRRFDFDLLATAATAVRLGARFIGTNEDATHPTPQRLLPGSGAILAAVATAAQATPEVAGKPHGPFVALVRARGRRRHFGGGGPTLHRRSTGAAARSALRAGPHRRDLRRSGADGDRARRGGARSRRPRDTAPRIRPPSGLIDRPKGIHPLAASEREP